MATYLIGDVQGCYQELQQLLEHINYDPAQDRLGFAGDLVNRGPQSLEVLRFIKSLTDPIIVLGNHDIYCLMLGYNAVSYDGEHSLHAIFEAPDKEALLAWLRQQPLYHRDDTLGYVLTHAGILPGWTLATLQQEADAVSAQLAGPHYMELLQQLVGDQPACWNAQLKGIERLRFTVNVLTRMRFVDHNHCLLLNEKGPLSHANENTLPWFEQVNPADIDHYQWVFGHWAALEGKTQRPGFHAIDTGCVWGKQLTALRMEDLRRFSVAA